jgi:hypothetical protein
MGAITQCRRSAIPAGVRPDRRLPSGGAWALFARVVSLDSFAEAPLDAFAVGVRLGFEPLAEPPARALAGGILGQTVTEAPHAARGRGARAPAQTLVEAVVRLLWRCGVSVFRHGGILSIVANGLERDADERGGGWGSAPISARPV